MSARARSTAWVVIPGWNEEKYIRTVLAKVAKVTSNIIVVDDGSTDSFARIARTFTPHVLSHAVNLGKGAALKTGCDYAFSKLKASAVIFMDSDDQHDPDDLHKFFQALDEQHQVIFGVRAFDQNMPLVRILSNRALSLIVKFLFGTYVPDIPSGYKALTSTAYKRVKWEATDYSVEMEIAVKVAKYRLDFIPIPVKTIYHDLVRGMTVLDTMGMFGKLLLWRIWL